MSLLSKTRKALLAGLVAHPPPLPVRNLLRILVAELHLAGIPAHAAVDSAVRLARERPKTRTLAGLVNAVGRRVAADRSRLVRPPRRRRSRPPPRKRR